MPEKWMSFTKCNETKFVHTRCILGKGDERRKVPNVLHLLWFLSSL